MTNQDYTPAKGTGPFAFTMRDILAIGFRHKRVLVLCFGGVLLGTLLAAILTPPNYRAETRILVKHERVDPVVSAEQSAPTSQARNDEVTEEQLNSEAALVTSDDVLRQTVVACGLQHHKSLTGWLFGRKEEEKIAKAVDALKANLKVEPVRKSNLISVSYESSDPKQAAAVLTTLSKGYIDKHLEVHRPPGQLKFFEQETELYRQDLDNAENQLKQF